MAKRKNFYAVRVGRKPGVYDSWEACDRQTKRFPGNVYKGFSTEEDARKFVNEGEVKVASPSHAGKPSVRYCAVAVGREPGIYTECAQAKVAYSDYLGAVYKEFSTLEDAEEYMIKHSKTPAEDPVLISDDDTGSEGDAISEGDDGSNDNISFEGDSISEEDTVSEGDIISEGDSISEGDTDQSEDETDDTPISVFGDIDEELMPPPASQSYFDQHADFKPDKNACFNDEFSRFASSQGIVSGTQEYRKQRTEAICHELRFHFSQSNNATGFPEDSDEITEDERLEIYQNMCRVIEIEPCPTAQECAMALKCEWVNIIDFIDAAKLGKKVERWDDWEAFRTYSLDDEHRINLGVAKASGFLEALLQPISRKSAPGKFVGIGGAYMPGGALVKSSGQGEKRKKWDGMRADDPKRICLRT